MPKDDSDQSLTHSQVEWFRATIVRMLVENKEMSTSDYARGIHDGYEMALNVLRVAYDT